MTVVVGGVSHLFQGDLDAGRRAIRRLEEGGLPDGALAEDFDYGAVAVAQRLEELRPDALVLVGARERGRPPGSVERRDVRPRRLPPGRIQRAVAEAITGSMDMDLVLEVASGLGALPSRTVTVEIEPAITAPSTTLSREVDGALDELVAAVRDEIQRLSSPA